MILELSKLEYEVVCFLLRCAYSDVQMSISDVYEYAPLALPTDLEELEEICGELLERMEE